MRNSVPGSLVSEINAWMRKHNGDYYLGQGWANMLGANHVAGARKQERNRLKLKETLYAMQQIKAGAEPCSCCGRHHLPKSETRLHF